VSGILRDPAPSQEDWPPDSQKCIFLGRALDHFSQDDLWAGLRSGELEARVYRIDRTDFGPVPISAHVFRGMDKGAVFRWFQIEVLDTDTRRPGLRRRVTMPHWLYITRASLDEFQKKHPATAAAETRAKTFLAERLKADPDMRREDARAACQKFKISDQGFEDRVWPDAREAAGLSRFGHAGRKSRRKSRS
jgi:hypothetical protein